VSTLGTSIHTRRRSAETHSNSLSKLENGRAATSEAKLKVMFVGQVLVIYVNYPISLDMFTREIRDACKVADFEQLTIKWMDDEGGRV
jgi:hypothetical protein